MISRQITRMTLEENPTSCARRVLARDAIVELIDTGSKKDRGSEGAFFPCTSTTHIKSMLFIHVIIAYYTFAAAGHEAPLSSLFSLKKYLNLKKGRWLRNGKIYEKLLLSQAWRTRFFMIDIKQAKRVRTNEPSFFFYYSGLKYDLRNFSAKNLKT